MRWILMFVMVGALSTIVYGQELETVLDEHPRLTTDMDTAAHRLARVFVQTTSGRALEGHLLTVDPDAVAILIDRRRVEIPFSQVQRIQTAGDSLQNGAWIGAFITGIWCAIVCSQTLDGPEVLSFAVAVNAAVGAAIGAGVDAMIPGRTTIYRRPTSSAIAQVPRPALSWSLRF